MTIENTYKEQKERSKRKSFMHYKELIKIRTDVLVKSQAEFVKYLIDPATGEPMPRETLSRWERGVSPVPLWAARKIRMLAGGSDPIMELLNE